MKAPRVKACHAGVTAVLCMASLGCRAQASSSPGATLLPTAQDRPAPATLSAKVSDLPEEPRPVDSESAHAAVLFAPETPHNLSADDQVSVSGFPVRFLKDELHIITSPARVRRHDMVWLLPLAGASAAAFATDTRTNRDVVSHNPSFNQAGDTSSDVLRGLFIGVPVVLFGAGHLARQEHPREAGLLAGEAMVDAYVFSEGVKYIMLRERPYLQNSRGHFFQGDAASDPSFVSGHSIIAWSSAAVLAGEYSKPWQQAAIYTLATGASLTRVLGQEHFPSDVLLGAASGWLIGHYVYGAHHRHTTK